MKRHLKALIFTLIFVFGIFNMLSFADTEYSFTLIQSGMRITTQKAPGARITLGIKESSGVRGWKIEQGNITIENNSFTMPSESVVISAKYELDEYTITYNLDGGVNNVNNPVTYNEETSTITLQAPTKTGYTFIGWTGSNGTSPELTVTIPEGSTGNKTYTANWQINSYTITATAGANGTITPASATVEYNGSATFTITQNSGYVLSSLKVDGNAVNTVLSYTITNVQKDTTITAEFSPISYTISYDLDGGTVTNPTSYTIETESFTLNEPTREGYTFTGWTGSNGTTAQKEVTINKGSTGNRNYTANWEVNNVAPTTPTVTTSNKTTNSFVVSAVATDVDGDSLTYTLYVGGSAKETKTASSGTTVTFSTVTGLSEYTTYSYYVTVTDGKATTTSSTGSIRTKCSGTSLTCTTTYCSAGKCSNCDGDGTVAESCDGSVETYWENDRCDYCNSYVQKTSSNPLYKCSQCGYVICNSCVSEEISDTPSDDAFYLATRHNTKVTCTSCNGSGYACSHKLSYSHRTCSHYSTTTLTSHKYCTHGKTSEHD